MVRWARVVTSRKEDLTGGTSACCWSEYPPKGFPNRVDCLRVDSNTLITLLRGVLDLPGQNSMAGQRVLLVHLTSNGDCLMATTVTRQIKNDYSGCNLTWAISRKCQQVIENDPFVDEIWPIESEPYDHPHGDV